MGFEFGVWWLAQALQDLLSLKPSGQPFQALSCVPEVLRAEVSCLEQAQPAVICLLRKRARREPKVC